MKRLFYLLTALIFPLTVFSTAQEGDILIWNGDTLAIFSNPLELRDDIDSLRPKLFGDQEASMNTACWRGYIAEWTLIENEIYLTNILSCNYYADSINSIKSDLETVFGAEYKNGKVKASWITGEILIPKGKLIHYVHSGYRSFFETELVLTFKDGILTNQKEYDNSKSYKSIFSQNQDSLRNFIHKNINWEIIPDLADERVRVIINIESSETKKPHFDIMRGAENELFNKEALRVMSLIPEWDVYYKLGKVYRMRWTQPIVFDEQTRKKYAH